MYDTYLQAAEAAAAEYGEIWAEIVVIKPQGSGWEIQGRYAH